MTVFMAAPEWNAVPPASYLERSSVYRAEEASLKIKLTYEYEHGGRTERSKVAA